MSQSQKDKYCSIALICTYLVKFIVKFVAKFIERENRIVVARGEGMGGGELFFHGYRVGIFQNEMSHGFWLHNSAKVLPITNCILKK